MLLLQNGRGPPTADTETMEAFAREVVDADEEVRAKIESLLLQSDNKKIVNMLQKLMRMIAGKVRKLSSETDAEMENVMVARRQTEEQQAEVIFDPAPAKAKRV